MPSASMLVSQDDICKKSPQTCDRAGDDQRDDQCDDQRDDQCDDQSV